jgi:hypothetical protein
VHRSVGFWFVLLAAIIFADLGSADGQAVDHGLLYAALVLVFGLSDARFWARPR